MSDAAARRREEAKEEDKKGGGGAPNGTEVFLFFFCTDDEVEGVKGDTFCGGNSVRDREGEAKRRCGRKVWRMRWGDGFGRGGVGGWATNLCTHFHRPALPRHCGSSPACTAGSAAP